MTKEYRQIENTYIETKSTDVWSCNGLHVEAGTNGYHGGDAGHGCRSFFTIRDLGNTDFDFGRVTDPFERCEGILVTFAGDSELDTFIEALKFIVTTLESQKNGRVCDDAEI